MRTETPMTVDRGRYPLAVTPWERESWREAALGWARDALAVEGLRVTGPFGVRLRPWSVLVRMPVEGRETAWFKASPPAGAFEAGLTEALSRWVPEHVLRPYAVEAERGWSLLPDGGPLLREVLDGAPENPGTWEEALRGYAAMQHALLPRTGEIEALGVPLARTAALPALFDRAVADNTALETADREALRVLRPRLADWCAELAGLGIADTLDHSDLHDGQLFAPAPGRFTFFDWGDAAVSHPFCSFLIPGRTAAERYGPEVLPRLRDAYLEPWTGEGVTTRELRRAVGLAWRLGAISRSRSWSRLFPGASAAGGTTGDAEGAYWLRELGADPPL